LATRTSNPKRKRRRSLNVKIILEFNDDEESIADMAYKGPKLVLAAEDFAEHLRTTIKYNENLSAEELRVYTRLQERFYSCFQGLLND
jgi:hypothetical protein